MYFRYFLMTSSCKKGGALHLNKLESTSPKDALCQYCLKLNQVFQGRRHKYLKSLQTMYNQIPVILNNLCLSFKLAMRNLPIFSSPEPHLITIFPLSVVFVNFSHFLLLQNHWANFNQALYKAPLGEVDSSLFK